MASRITAIRQMRADLKRWRTMSTATIVKNMSSRSGLSTGEIVHVIYEMQDQISSAARDGQAVKIEGLGTFTPTLRADGRINLVFRADPRFLDKLNSEALYAKIINKENIGKSADELVALWNESHPDDPVE